MSFKTSKQSLVITWAASGDPVVHAVQYRDLVVQKLQALGYTLELRESFSGAAKVGFYTIQQGSRILGTLQAHTRQYRFAGCNYYTDAAITVEWSKSLGVAHGVRSTTWCRDTPGTKWKYAETLDKIVSKIDTTAKKILAKLSVQDQAEQDRRDSAQAAREVTKMVACPEGVEVIGTDDPGVLMVKVRWTGPEQDVARLAHEFSKLVRAYNRPEE
jgi:hypothetical protein